MGHNTNYGQPMNVVQKLIGIVIIWDISAPKRVKREVKQDCEGSGGSKGWCPQDN